MYMLRLISAVLHEARGSTVADEAMDLRPGELALVVPLVAGLLAALGVAGRDQQPLVRRPTQPTKRGPGASSR